MTLSHLDDGEIEFNGELSPSPDRVLRADGRLVASWSAALKKINEGRSRPVALPSPIDALPELMRVRQLPAMPWPATWTETARRARTYPGQITSVIGGTGSGKTQWAIEVARSFSASARGCVLWVGGEDSPGEVDLRIVSNLSRVHMYEIREDWSEERIRHALMSVTDRWRFIDIIRGTLVEQMLVIDLAIEHATSIYGAPPLVVVDYIQKFARGREDQRAAVSEVMDHLHDMVRRRECYMVCLSQASRSNAPVLAGNAEVPSSTDMISVGAETANIERDSTNQIVLNVFKADDADELDAHIHFAKCRNTGKEGKAGARYHKPGGWWEELDHFPATPLEVRAEVARSKKSRAAPPTLTVEAARQSLNSSRADGARAARREAILAAIRDAGPAGLGGRALRAVRGAGSPRHQAATVAELLSEGRLRAAGGKWVFVL